jgi:Holliday junction resolvase
VTRRRRTFETESELVERAAEWLRTDGWECYFEVAPWGSGAQRADIVATRGSLLTVVECKLSLGWAVLAQCETWLRYAHLVWAAVPWAERAGMAERVAEHFGIGVLEVGHAEWRRRVHAHPGLRRRVDADKVRSVLSRAQQDTTPGSRGAYDTPFRQTCAALVAAVKDAGGRLAAKDAITGLKHHYSSASCARSSLIERAERGVVEGIRIAREGKAVFFEVAS